MPTSEAPCRKRRWPDRPGRVPAALLLATVLLYAACTPQTRRPDISDASADAEAQYQRELVLRDSISKLDQLNRISWRLLSANVPLCGDRVGLGTGFTLLELDSYKKEKRELLKTVLGLGWRPTVFEVAAGSPAEKAGLRRGDVIVGIGNQKCEHKKQVREAVAELLKQGRPVEIGFERKGEFMTTVLFPRMICKYPIELEFNQEINAFADGERIVVYYGMMKFVRNDDELAAILAHELAHNTRGHRRDKTVNSVIGALLVDLPVAVLTGVRTHAGQAVGGNAFSQDFEYEADYVGLYFSARAGFDVHHVGDVWRRMSIEYPQAITLGTTHPSNSRRFVALEAGAAEIDAKIAAGKPLVPEEKAASKDSAAGKDTDAK